MKITDETYYPEDDSAIKDIGRYTAATLEYSSLVLFSVFERGGRSVSGGVDAVSSPYKKALAGIDGAVAPLKRLGKRAKKLMDPLTRTARQVAEVSGDLGVPVHLDKKSIAILQRIEERLANIESKGLSVAAAQHPTADDFKEKPSKEKNMLLRAVLEDSKHALEE